MKDNKTPEERLLEIEKRVNSLRVNRGREIVLLQEALKKATEQRDNLLIECGNTAGDIQAEVDAEVRLGAAEHEVKFLEAKLSNMKKSNLVSPAEAEVIKRELRNSFNELCSIQRSEVMKIIEPIELIWEKNLKLAHKCTMIYRTIDDKRDMMFPDFFLQRAYKYMRLLRSSSAT